jgi:hypothetical protein
LATNGNKPTTALVAEVNLVIGLEYGPAGAADVHGS